MAWDGHFAGSLIIGLNAPFTGHGSIEGESIERGASLAVEAINGTGGVVVKEKHYKLQVQKLDSQSERAQRSSFNTAQMLASKGIAAIIEEGAGIRESRTLSKARLVPHWVIGDGGNEVVDAQRFENVFRMSPLNAGMVPLLVGAAYRAGCNRFGVITDDSEPGTDVRTQITGEVARQGGGVAAEEIVHLADTSVATQITHWSRRHRTALSPGPTRTRSQRS